MPNILLINPWIYDFAAYDLWSRPLGLLYIGAALQKQGAAVNLIDCLNRYHPLSGAPLKQGRLENKGAFRRQVVDIPPVLSSVPRHYARYGYPLDLFKEKLKKQKPPQVILIHSLMTYWYLGPYQAAAIIREIWPKVPIFIGGIYATLCTEHAENNPYNMIVAPGPFEDLKADFWNNHLKSDLADLFIKASAEKFFSFRPAWHLYQNKLPVLTLLTSRGCPGSCPYCASKVLHPKMILRDLEDVLDEIKEALQTRGTEEIVFYDDALNLGPKGRFETFLEGLVKLKEQFPQQKIRLPNGLFVNAINQKRANLMKKAGFKTIRLGLESTNPATQQKMGAKVGPGEFEKAALALKKAGFSAQELGAYILVSWPGSSSYQDAYQTAKKAVELGFRPHLAEYSPTPDTKWWALAQEESSFDLSKEPLYHNNIFQPLRGANFSFEKFWEFKRSVISLIKA